MTTCNQPAGPAHTGNTLNINLSAQQIGTTNGSMDWLLKQCIETRFREETYDGQTARIAEIGLNGTWMPVAADGADLAEGALQLVPAHGVHEFEVPFDSPYASELTFGVPLTLGAQKVLEKVISEARMRFKEWTEESGREENLQIRFAAA